MNNNILRKAGVFLSAALFGSAVLTSCYESPDEVKPYGADQLTILQLISERPELSGYNAILSRCGYDKKLSTYLEYTCFAPVNDGISVYLDSLYNDDNKRFPHNGIQEVEHFDTLSVEKKIALMSDSLCEDICKYHTSSSIFQQINIGGDGTFDVTTLLQRRITASTFETGVYAGKTSLNGKSAVIEGDIVALNGILHVCSDIIPRSDRTVDDQLGVQPDMKIFYAALQMTGYDKIVQQVDKGIKYTYAEKNPTNRDDQPVYCPTECKVKWTIFAETDNVFNSIGIYTVDQLFEYCKDWYGNPTWYHYLKEKGITPSTKKTDYTNPFNVLNMFVAYHILRAGMPVSELVYEKNQKTQGSWNLCFGYEPQEYYETLLPHTLMKIWQVNPLASNVNNRTLYINRYRLNNTLTDEIGTFGSDETHPIIFKGVEIDRANDVPEALNGFIHRLKGVLLYDKQTVESQNERMRFDSSNFMYETINNGIRFVSEDELRGRFGVNGADLSRVAFDNTYFDNIVCYNPNTLLRFCVMGAWRSLNSDQFQGWDAYDFAIKLPPVPTGTYELRLVYPPMTRGGLMQFYLGESSSPNDMVAKGQPFDANYVPGTDPTNLIGWEPIRPYSEDDPDNDYGLASDVTMRVRGYMRCPACFSRGTYNTNTEKLIYDPNDIYSAAKSIVGSTNCRSESGNGVDNLMLRRIICTERFEQGKEYWLRIKNLVNNKNLGWSFDFIELCPVSVYDNQTMSEDWY